MSFLQIQLHNQIEDEKFDEKNVFVSEFILHHQHIQSSKVQDEN